MAAFFLQSNFELDFLKMLSIKRWFSLAISRASQSLTESTNQNTLAEAEHMHCLSKCALSMKG